MKAVQLAAYGGVDQFQVVDLPIPTAGPGQILLKIEASAVNPFDLLVRAGYVAQFIPLPLPAILGGDAAGTVAAVGPDVTGFAIGDRIVADFPTEGRGSHAEYGVISVSAVAPLPDTLSFEQGAALPKAGLTGRQCVEALDVKPGEHVLVSGALGSVGRAAVQYLQEMGAHPVAGVRTDRLDEARALAGDAIDLAQEPAGPQYDKAISTAGPAVSHLIAHVRDGGTVVSIVPVPEGEDRAGAVTIQQLYHRTDAQTLADVATAAGEGRLVIPIARVYPLDELAAAEEAVAQGARGKVVLKH